MAKPTNLTAATRSRRELATEHLAEVRRRAADLDAKGEALVAELARGQSALGAVVMDVLEDPGKRPELVELRRRIEAIPAEIERAQLARTQLDQELHEAEAALRYVHLADAAEIAVTSADARAKLAIEIDATLQRLAQQWSGYAEAGARLREAFDVLGIPPDYLTLFDPENLQAALKRTSQPLALAVGCNPGARFVVGDMKYVPDLANWDSRPTLAEADAGEAAIVRMKLTMIAPQAA